MPKPAETLLCARCLIGHPEHPESHETEAVTEWHGASLCRKCLDQVTHRGAPDW